MKKVISFVLVLLLVYSFQANAELLLRGEGTSDYGTYRLIYDTDFDITWYDFTNDRDFWSDQIWWASTLVVNFGGTIYDDWRLPTTADGSYVYGYDGTTSGGYNITSSEMGHLFYSELGNQGYIDTSGNLQTGYGLTNTGDFQNLYSTGYWTSGEYGSDPEYGDGWYFSTGAGKQATLRKDHDLNAIAVRSGDVTVVPEPVSSTLFLIGAGVLAGRRYLRRIR
jgi:hypothetical protein